MNEVHWDSLKYSLQALAESADFQRRLLSIWREDVSELPERFVQAERQLTRGACHEFTDDQKKALAALSAKFESFCGPVNADHWQKSALEWSPHWRAIRVLAAECLLAFAWPLVPPPLEITCYGEDYHD